MVELPRNFTSNAGGRQTMASKRNFGRELEDPRTRAEVELRTQRRLERSARLHQAEVRIRSAGACRGIGRRRVLRRAHGREVRVVENVVALENELTLHALRNRNRLRDPGVERNKLRKIERIASDSGHSVCSAVAVVIQVEINHGRIRLSRLRRQNRAQRPASRNITHALDRKSTRLNSSHVEISYA